jgi:hypothetical protein
MVDQAGEQVGRRVEHPDTARDRTDPLVAEAGGGLPDGVGSQDRVGVHEHDQLAAPPPDGLVLGGALAGVAVEQPDRPVATGEPLIDGQQRVLVARPVVDQPDAHGPLVVLAGHRTAARLQQGRVLVEAGDHHVDRRPPGRHRCLAAPPRRRRRLRNA